MSDRKPQNPVKEKGSTSVLVLRGGYWLNCPFYLKAAYRSNDRLPYSRSGINGFRIARTKK